MPSVTYVNADGREFTVDVQLGVDLMKGALLAAVPGIIGECGGSLVCATCRVDVPEAWQSRVPAAKSDEVEMLGFCDHAPPASRLSCQIKMSEELENIRLLIPEDQYNS